MSKSLISEDLTIVGNIESKSAIEILGSVTGDINAASVDIGESGKVEGKVNSEDVQIHGWIKGALSAVSVTVHSQAVVSASINAETMISENGARIVGKVNVTGSKDG